VGSSAGAAPKSYVFSGKLTSNRGSLLNIPMLGNAACNGVGLSNFTVMFGPGGRSSRPEHAGRAVSRNASRTVSAAVGFLPGKKITTSGAGVGGSS
jgi:hypothetical protein